VLVAVHSSGHEHPADIFYVKIALTLGLLTALEVSTYFANFGKLFLPLLLVLMSIKFVLVVLFFMHARFDAKIFGRLFWTGLVLAVVVYGAVLTTFHFWKV
jgi:cytochrome c oxidase subunit IV